MTREKHLLNWPETKLPLFLNSKGATQSIFKKNTHAHSDVLLNILTVSKLSFGFTGCVNDSMRGTSSRTVCVDKLAKLKELFGEPREERGRLLERGSYLSLLLLTTPALLHPGSLHCN